jgi:hypothetical protein
MPNIALLTSDVSIQPLIQEVSDLLAGELSIAHALEDLYPCHIDLIFWYTYPFDQNTYRRIQVVCPKVIWLKDKQFMKKDPVFGSPTNSIPPVSRCGFLLTLKKCIELQAGY